MKQNVIIQSNDAQNTSVNCIVRYCRKMSLYAGADKDQNHSAHRLYTDPLPASQQALFPERQAATFAKAQHLPDLPCRLH